MGYFHSSGNAPGTRLVQALTPASAFGIDQNSRLLNKERPFFEAEIGSLTAPDDHQLELAQELTDNLAITAYDGQQFGALWLNRQSRESDGKVQPLVVLNGFLSNMTDLDDKLRLYFIARLLPDRPIVAVEPPSQGVSSLYSREQRSAMFRRGDLSGVGTNMHQALTRFFEERIPAADSMHVHAVSFGARLGLDVVKANLESSDAVDIGSLQLFELPGTRERRVGLHAAYFGYEWLRSKQYQRGWVESTKLQFANYLQRYAVLDSPGPNFFQRDPKTAVWNFWHSVLGYATGAGLFSELTSTEIPITRVVGSASRIDNPVYARWDWSDLGGRFALLIASHESHDGLGALSHARLRAKLIASLALYPPISQDLSDPLEFNMYELCNNEPARKLAASTSA